MPSRFNLILSGNKPWWILSGSMLALALGINLGLSPKVQALTNVVISNEAPLPGSAEGNDGTQYQPYLIVGGGVFDGNYTYLKIYVPVTASSATVTVEGGKGVCPDVDGFNPVVDYSLYRLTDLETYPTSGAQVPPQIDQANSQPLSGCGDIILNIDNSLGVASVVAGHTGYKVYYFEAVYIANLTGEFTAGKFFRLRVDTSPAAPGGLVGYSRPIIDYGGNGNSFFGMRLLSSIERSRQATPVQNWDFQLQFGPRCDDPSPANAAINVFDADVDIFNPQNMSATLENYLKSTPPPPAWVLQESWDESDLGTPGISNETKDLDFNADNQHGYRFTWYGPNWNNTLQMRVPYDQFDAQQEVQCPPPGNWEYLPAIAPGTGQSNTVRPGEIVSVSGTTSNVGENTGPGYNQTVYVSSGSVSSPNSFSLNFATGLNPRTSGLSQDVTFTIGSSTPVGGQVCFVTETRPHSGTVVAGVFTVVEPADVSEPFCVTVVESPYLKVYGNDIWSGGNYYLGGGICPLPPGTGDIRSVSANIVGSPTNYVGAVEQYAAFAFGNIDAFGTAEVPEAGTGYNTLAFANTGAELGWFGYARCLYNIFDDDPGGPGGQIDDLLWLNAVNTNNVNSEVNNSSSEQYRFNGDATINGGSPITGQKTILVNGSVTIGQDLQYDQSMYGDTTSLEDVPILIIIATRDIIIEPDVRQLDGMYISLQTIHTCPLPASGFLSVEDGCSQVLEVNGSFIANQIAFRRTAGGINGASTGDPAHTDRCNYFDPPDFPSPGMTLPNNNDIDCVAEIFRFSPEMYLADPIFRRGADFEIEVQQVRELPPIF